MLGVTSSPCHITLCPRTTVPTGQPVTFFECLGPNGQDIAQQWLRQNPGYRLRRIQCSIGNDPVRLRDQVESPQA